MLVYKVYLNTLETWCGSTNASCSILIWHHS